MTILKKLISGGQTGCDQAALDAALECGFEIGGWCPPNRVCEDGIIPEKYPLIETPRDRSALKKTVPRSLRTEWNVRDADATLILRPEGNENRDPGTDWTVSCASRYAKPMLMIDPNEADRESTIRDWLVRLKVRVLNIAGPSEKTSPGIGKKVYSLLKKAFKNLS